MAPTVLGLGIPASSPMTPEHLRAPLQAALDKMESDLQSSPYDWEMFYYTPDMPFDLLLQKLKEKEWDCVMVGMGLRTIAPLIPLFERVINVAHAELPKTKFAFNVTIEATREAIARALAL